MEIPKFTSTYHNSPYPRISPTQPSLSQKGKTVFITGGGRGIGKAIARNFAISGTNVFIVGRSETDLRNTADELSKLTTSKVAYQPTDVTSSDAVKSAFQTMMDKFKVIDVVVSNAGYLDDHVPFASADLEDYWRGFEINVKAGIIVAQDKIAFVRICEYLQSEHMDLRVFSIQPGGVETQMSKKAGMDHQPDDTELPGAFCVWLASSEADFLKGKFVWANWDIDELIQKKDVIASDGFLTMGLLGWPNGLE